VDPRRGRPERRVAGILCLISPIVATVVDEAVMAWTLTLIGCLNLTGLFFAEPNQKAYHGVIGLLQLVVGVVMIKNPFGTLLAVTVMIAVVIFCDGLYAIIACLSNRNMRGWGFALAGGVASTLLGIVVFTGLPESSVYTIGILLGVDFLTVGNFRIHIALEGREAITA
jgi:uncharacterized membrane protein HdeD (DUF308 family)